MTSKSPMLWKELRTRRFIGKRNIANGSLFFAGLGFFRGEQERKRFEEK